MRTKLQILLVFTIAVSAIIGVAVGLEWWQRAKSVYLIGFNLLENKDYTEEDGIKSLIDSRYPYLEKLGEHKPSRTIYSLIYFNKYIPAAEVSAIFNSHDIELVGLYYGWRDHIGTYAPSDSNMNFDEIIQELEISETEFLEQLNNSALKTPPIEMSDEALKNYEKSTVEFEQMLYDLNNNGITLYAVEVKAAATALLSILNDPLSVDILEGIIPEIWRSEVHPFVPFWIKSDKNPKESASNDISGRQCDVSNQRMAT